MGKAKVAGLIGERKEVDRPGEFENMSIDELRECIVRESQKLGISVSFPPEEVGNRTAGGKPQGVSRCRQP
jgi:hypothetical protein